MLAEEVVEVMEELTTEVESNAKKTAEVAEELTTKTTMKDLLEMVDLSSAGPDHPAYPWKKSVEGEPRTLKKATTHVVPPTTYHPPLSTLHPPPQTA